MNSSSNTPVLQHLQDVRQHHFQLQWDHSVAQWLAGVPAQSVYFANQPGGFG
jgi:hypothetical protein